MKAMGEAVLGDPPAAFSSVLAIGNVLGSTSAQDCRAALVCLVLLSKVSL